MSKKFNKISPKDISEEKFNQLIEALPSSDLVGTVNQPIESEQSSNTMDTNPVVVAETKPQDNSVSLNRTRKEVTEDTLSENFDNLVEVFVYEVGNLSFGIPVSFVTEITNDYAPVSKLDGFIRSCLGTCEYRGKLIPIFDSERAYLKVSKNGKTKKKHKKNLLNKTDKLINNNE